MNIAFDIDGCTLNVMPRMQAELSMRGIKIINPEDGYWFETEPKLADEDWIELWGVVFADFKKTPPYDGAMHFLTALNERTKKPIHFITSRNIKHAYHTHKAIRHYLKCPFTISFANRPFKKADYMNSCKWIVEDNPHEVQDLIQHGKIPIMPRRKWNASLDYNINHEISELWDFMHILID